jgi:uncharacterized protein YndB with AHSA1/START domain
MEQKTKVQAEAGRHDLFISRDFELPLELLFQAYTDPIVLAQWMGTRVLKLERKKHRRFQIEPPGPTGTTLGLSGVIHDFVPTRKIIRTFEMTGMNFGVQLEVIEFEKTAPDNSRLNKHIIYESVAKRDENLKLPFAYGINRAHNRLQEIVHQLK